MPKRVVPVQRKAVGGAPVHMHVQENKTHSLVMPGILGNIIMPEIIRKANEWEIFIEPIP